MRMNEPIRPLRTAIATSIRPRRRKARGASLALGVVLAASAAGAPSAAQEGFVAGVVEDARTLQPLAGAQIVVQGTERGTITDDRGRFRIQGLGGTAVTLEVHLIGYRTHAEPARVGDAAVRIRLQQSAVNLEEIVVTGTPGGTQKKALGNTVATLDAGDLQELAPAQDVQQLLKGRASSVMIEPASGMVGAGGRVRIRGVNSLSLDSDPLIYIDGVRVDNAERTAPGANVWQTGNRLNDIDPSEIESIEVIKGPAAATLYGTEASNGVIQIITKRGRQGRPRFTLSVDQGANWVHDPEGRFPTYFRRNADGSVFSYNGAAAEAARGTPIFTTGHVQRYDLEVSGGSEAVQYYLTGGYNDEEGPVQPNALQRYRMRGNIVAVLGEKADVGLNVGYSSGRTDVAREYLGGVGWAWWPCVTAACHEDGRGFALAGAHDERRQVYTEWEDLNRFTGGVTLNYTPWSFFTNRLVVGLDESTVDQVMLAQRQSEPRFMQVFGAQALGYRESDLFRTTTTTVDYAGTFSASLPKGLASKTSVGVQYYREYLDRSGYIAEEFPAEGVTAIDGAARIQGEGTFVENITVGTYVQQQLSLNDRLFLTAAIRADDNSAFGEDFDLVTYPKVSAAWVVSEEPFWGLDLLNTLRLRAAYGQSGKQPVSFAALRVYLPYSAPGGVAGVRPQSVGNPDLGPERGEEIEAGLDAGLLDDRLGLELTFYDKRTKDVILERQIAPSAGFSGSKPVNIGEVKNTGLEFSVTGVPLQRENLAWDLALTAGYNRNEITDMGGVPPLTFITQTSREGFPVFAFFGQKVVSADVGADGRATNVLCDGGTGKQGLEPGGAPVPCATAPLIYLGKPTPDWEGSLSTNLTLFQRLQLYAMVDFQYDVQTFDWSTFGPCVSSLICDINVFPEAAQADPIAAGEASFFHFGGSLHPDRSFARLRQVSASYTLPERYLSRFGASSARLTLSARNLPFVLTDYQGIEPDVNTRYSAAGTGSYHYHINFEPTPQSTQIITSLRLTF